MKSELLLSRAQPGLAGYGALIASTDKSVIWTSAEVGHALAGLPWWCRDLVLLKWALVKMELDCLVRHAVRRARQRVELPSRALPGRVFDMSRAALLEVVSATLCRDCDGHGHVRDPDNPHAWLPCARCEGLGVAPWSWRERSRNARCNEAAFRRGWNRVYDELRRIYIADEDQALRVVSKHVRGL